MEVKYSQDEVDALFRSLDSEREWAKWRYRNHRRLIGFQAEAEVHPVSARKHGDGFHLKNEVVTRYAYVRVRVPFFLVDLWMRFFGAKGLV